MGVPGPTGLSTRPRLVGLELPPDFAERLGQAVWGGKHLPGKHDQRTHGHGKWAGPISGGSPRQQELVREALGEIPTTLLPPGMAVKVGPPNRFQERIFGKFGGVGVPSNTLWLNSRHLGKRGTDKFDIVHEGGHAVMANALKRSRLTGGVSGSAMRELASELRFASPYAMKNADEAWAEGFAARITRGTSFGPKSEAIFNRLGI